MGISFSLLDRLRGGGFLKKRSKVLDIGSSNLYRAGFEQLRDFILHYRPAKIGSDLDVFASRLAEGSSYNADKGGVNEAFAGELLDYCGIDYLSFDIAAGYRTEIFDLNRQQLRKVQHGTFDTVLNIGTTEHVLNQYNSFEVIHDATKVGGYIVHQLPAAGFTDHGYFVYTGRLLFDLAGYNGYEIADIWYEGPVGEDDLYASVRSYKTYFPKLTNLADAAPLKIPNWGLTIVMCKMKPGRFLACLETSTAVGDIPAKVRGAYRAPPNNLVPMLSTGRGAFAKWFGRLKHLRRISRT